MKPKIPYRKRRDLALKKFSSLEIQNHLTAALKERNLIQVYKEGRPCDVSKYRLIAYIVDGRQHSKVYELLEEESDVYLNEHYDVSTLQYHYEQLTCEQIYDIAMLFRDKIYTLSNEIILHVLDSTALSSSVRDERTRQGLRKKEKITDKIHTVTGYDPPLQILIVEDIIMSDHHLSDGKGGEKIVSRNNFKGYIFGDSKYGTYDLIQLAEDKLLFPVLKQDKRNVRKGLSAKARRKKQWNGNPKRLCKEIRGMVECIYGGATRAGLIKTNSLNENNRYKDGLLIALRQNLYTYLRLKSLIRVFRKSPNTVSPNRK
jgi:hypothetical protein